MKKWGSVETMLALLVLIVVVVLFRGKIIDILGYLLKG